MDQNHLQEIAQRDQLWASLRALQAEIEQIAAGELTGSARERQLIQILGRVVASELKFRAERTEPE